MTGLVNIAQRGRSLGIHLILATQRPSGVVSADIRANTNLRIALRVTDAAESADVIDAPGRRAHLPDHARAAATSGSATPRWCRSRPAGSAAAGPARRRPGRPWLPSRRGWPGLDWAGTAAGPETADGRPPGSATTRRSPT